MPGPFIGAVARKTDAKRSSARSEASERPTGAQCPYAPPGRSLLTGARTATQEVPESRCARPPAVQPWRALSRNGDLSAPSRYSV